MAGLVTAKGTPTKAQASSAATDRHTVFTATSLTPLADLLTQTQGDKASSSNPFVLGSALSWKRKRVSQTAG